MFVYGRGVGACFFTSFLLLRMMCEISNGDFVRGCP